MFEYPLKLPIPVQSEDSLAMLQLPQGEYIFRVYYIQSVNLIVVKSHLVLKNIIFVNLI